MRRRERRNTVGWVGRYLSPACTVFSIAGLLVCFGLTALWGMSSRHHVQYFRGPVMLAAWTGVLEVRIDNPVITELDGHGPGLHWRRNALPDSSDAPWFRFADAKFSGRPIVWSFGFTAYLPFWLVIGAATSVTVLLFWCRNARTWMTLVYRVTTYGCIALASLWVASIFWSISIVAYGGPRFSLNGGCLSFSWERLGPPSMMRNGGVWQLRVTRGTRSWTLPALGLTTPRVIGVASASGVSVPIWLLAGLALGPACLIARTYGKQFGAGHCRKCGYDLTGNESGVCSECGEKIVRARAGSREMLTDPHDRSHT